MATYIELSDDYDRRQESSHHVSALSKYKIATGVAVAFSFGVIALTTSSNLQSAPAQTHTVLQTTTTTCPKIEQGVDYLANDLANVAGTGATDCCTKCAQRTGCGAFTWSNYNGGTCWLKTAKGATKATTGVVSAVLSTTTTVTTGTCPTVQQGVDYVGNDIASVAGTGAADCCTKCNQRVGCGAFTWSNYNGGTCWLKSSKGTTKTTSGVVSAVLTRTTTTTTTTAPPAATTPAPTTTAPASTTKTPTATTLAPTTTAPTPPPTTVSPTTPPPTQSTAAPSTSTCPTIEQGVEYVGNDLISVAGSSAADCCATCTKLTGCEAFTLINGKCALKSGKGATATKSGAVSGRVMRIPVAEIYDGSTVGYQVNLNNGNPTSYPSNGCRLPNYISKNGKIFATGPNGLQDAIAIKGVNWFGMETTATLPLGLWTNDENGTTLYSIAAFLAKNKFNSVRLPICMDSLLQNIAPNQNLVNMAENQAVKVDTYMNALKSIIKGLGYRGISVLVDIHTLTTSDIGMLWYSDKITEQSFLNGVDLLTKNLCNDEYFNVLGLDLKNEPASGTWGDGSAKDFRAAAMRVGNRMLAGCPNWLAFVEGISEYHSWKNSAGKSYFFADWWGGGLAKAKQYPVTFNIASKLVYAPHYYSPSVYPIEYFFGDGFTELSDASLRENIKGTFDLMFGYLAQDTSGPAIVLGEFGGLYASDRHAKKTLQRSVQYTVELLMRPGFAGGYMWSLNPESGYEYNPGNTKGVFQEGLLLPNWRVANSLYLSAFAPLDKMADLKPLPCYKW